MSVTGSFTSALYLILSGIHILLFFEMCKTTVSAYIFKM